MTARSRPRGVLNVALVSAAALAFMAGTTGCGIDDDTQDAADVQETVQCVDANDNVVDDDQCDDDGDGHGGGGFFVFMSGGRSYPPGTRLDRTQYSRPPVRFSDTAGRSAAGLAPTGKVASGSRTISSAGIGKGSTGGKSGGTGEGGGS
jgi:hypothetical protein